jgi:hypothetical protein
MHETFFQFCEVAPRLGESAGRFNGTGVAVLIPDSSQQREGGYDDGREK